LRAESNRATTGQNESREEAYAQARAPRHDDTPFYQVSFGRSYFAPNEDGSRCVRVDVSPAERTWSTLVVRRIDGAEPESVHVFSEIMPRTRPRCFVLRERLAPTVPTHVVEHCAVRLTMREDRDERIGFDVDPSGPTPCMTDMPRFDQWFASCTDCLRNGRGSVSVGRRTVPARPAASHADAVANRIRFAIAIKAHVDALGVAKRSLTPPTKVGNSKVARHQWQGISGDGLERFNTQRVI
jgi:hypothetical protein